ncbi:hypothetical protein FSARC_12202 [Fusarium sarcochroum]|uniref:Apple domain-containing protein n=1 Tax=Fusarium sarcochroum TaxID=1208366 RepID=A0A8H4TA64_9HYPO|nr:hypothetical protein FSARC_12202 [Fusarium sarcochroum]
MKSFIFTAAVLGAVGIFSAADQASMEMDSWCITYLSTYLGPVSNQASALPSAEQEAEEPIAQDSGRLPLAPSILPTFRRNTSTSLTQSTLIEDVQDALTLDTSIISLQSVDTSRFAPVSAETSDLNVEPTGQLTDELATSATLARDSSSTTSTDISPTSSSINEPAGRSIILLVSVTDNGRRDLNKRATGGFVGNDHPDICTFAAVFNLAKDQLFEGGVPIYYSGEAFKDLAGQGPPSKDSITTTFTTSSEYLVFRNSGLPKGDAGFCQDSGGKVYITFTAGPPGCVPVHLAIYDIEQCQDGRLIGGPDLTLTSSEIVASLTAMPEDISTEGVTSIEGTSAVEETQSIESDSEGQFMSSSTIQIGSVDPVSQISESKSSVIASSSATDSSATLGSFITTIPTAKTSTARSSIPPSASDDSSPEEEESSTETEDSTSHANTSTDSTGLPTPDVETISSSTLNMASEDTSSIGMSAIDKTTTNADNTINDDTTTVEDQITTENPTTTGDTTIAVLDTTTSAAAIPTFSDLACSELSTPYNDPIGTSFDLRCDAEIGYSPLSTTQVASFTACLRFCAEDPQCGGVLYEKDGNACYTFSSSDGDFFETPDFDVALRIPEGGNRLTTEDQATTENPTTTADTTAAAVSTTAGAAPVGCPGLDSPYNDPNGKSFQLECNSALDGGFLLSIITTETFIACVISCAQDGVCGAVNYDRETGDCIYYVIASGSSFNNRYDAAFLVREEGN